MLCTGLLTACGQSPTNGTASPQGEVSLRMAVIQNVVPQSDVNPLPGILHSVQWRLSDGSTSYSVPSDVVNEFRIQNVDIVRVRIPRVSKTEGILVAGDKNGVWKTDALFLLPSPENQRPELDGPSLSKAPTTGPVSVPDVGDVDVYASADEMVCFFSSGMLALPKGASNVRLASGVMAEFQNAHGVNSLSYPYGSCAFLVAGNVGRGQLVSVANHYTPDRVFFTLNGHQSGSHVTVGT